MKALLAACLFVLLGSIVQAQVAPTPVPTLIPLVGLTATASTPGLTQTIGSDYYYNLFQIIQDNSFAYTASQGTHVYGLGSVLNFGGTNTGGEHDAVYGIATMTAAESTAPPYDNDFVGVVGECHALVNDNGTASAPLGACFGGNQKAVAENGATNMFSVIGDEVDVLMGTGNARYRWAFSAVSSGSTQASLPGGSDGAYQIGAGASPQPAWKTGLLFSAADGGPPISTNGCMICTDGNNATVAEGIDISAYTITGYEIRTPHSSIDQFGDGIWSGNGLFGGTLASSGNGNFNGVKVGQENGAYTIDFTNSASVYRDSTSGGLTLTSQGGYPIVSPSCFAPGNGTSEGSPEICGGNGVPNFTAPNASEYRRYDGTTGARVYNNICAASSTCNTWAAQASP